MIRNWNIVDNCNHGFITHSKKWHWRMRDKNGAQNMTHRCFWACPFHATISFIVPRILVVIWLASRMWVDSCNSGFISKIFYLLSDRTPICNNKRLEKRQVYAARNFLLTLPFQRLRPLAFTHQLSLDFQLEVFVCIKYLPNYSNLPHHNFGTWSHSCEYSNFYYFMKIKWKM